MRMPRGRTGSRTQSNRAGPVQAAAWPTARWPYLHGLTVASSTAGPIYVPRVSSSNLIHGGRALTVRFETRRAKRFGQEHASSRTD